MYTTLRPQKGVVIVLTILRSIGSSVVSAASLPTDDNKFDYVIVGGGLTGLVVASRLTEDPSVNVLVVENGHINRGYVAEVPYATVAGDTADMWNVTSAPEAYLGNVSFGVPVGNVVGGGSIVNGMACTRGNKADYDAWERLGNPGWGWDGLFPYFLKSTNYTPPLPEIVEEYGVTWNESTWGDAGPVQIGHPSYFYPDIKNFRPTWPAQGIRELTDGATGDNMGLFWLPIDIDTQTGTRSSARAAYYDPSAARPNLHLLTGHRAIEVLFYHGSALTANGVLIQSRADNSTMTVTATREVILAAGAVFTPHLLQRSGVGPKQALEAANVTVKLDLPSVGANFQDHPTIYMKYSVANLSFPNPASIETNATFNQTAWEEYEQNRTGPYTSGRIGANGNSLIYQPLSNVVDNFQAVADSMTSQNATDHLPGDYLENQELLAGFEAQRALVSQFFSTNLTACCEFFPSISGGAAVSLQKPLSRGTIKIDPADPAGYPIVHFNTFQNPLDITLVLAMLRLERRHWAQPELARFSPVETVPGAQYQTDEEILERVVATGNVSPTLAHPSGTCAMMSQDLGGCVGPDLLVYGIERLSVVDASILPLIPAAHLQITMYAVAEKAADIIKSRH